jgi:hypothetical protein
LVQPQVSHRTGSDNSGSANREGLNFSSTSTDLGGGTQKQTQFNTVAMLQFGGFTVGHMGSFFGAAAPLSNIGLDGWDQRDLTNTVGYTLSLGNGVTTTLALEDGTLVNRQGILNSNVTTATTTGAAVATANGTNNLVYGSNRLPDYIANIAVAQSWGSAQLSGALHTINASNSVTTATWNGSNTVNTQYGYALQANAKINLPMIAAGDYLWLNGIYSYAANAFTLRNSGGGDVNSNSLTGFGIGRVAVTMNDLVIDWTNNKTYKPTVWGAAAEFNHQWTPTVGTFLGGSYTQLSWDAAAQALGAATINPAKFYIANAGVTWTPVKGLRILADVEYGKIAVKTATNAGALAEGAAKKNEDQWIGRVQIRRDF